MSYPNENFINYADANGNTDDLRKAHFCRVQRYQRPRQEFVDGKVATVYATLTSEAGFMIHITTLEHRATIEKAMQLAPMPDMTPKVAVAAAIDIPPLDPKTDDGDNKQ